MIGEQVQQKQHKNNTFRDKKQVIDYLFQLFTPKKLPIRNQPQSHSLEIYLKVSPHLRTFKNIRKIALGMQSLQCFQFPEYLKKLNPEMEEIFNRDNKSLIEFAAPFVEIESYERGSVIEVSGMQRNNIRLLLHGSVAYFLPINEKSLKNCTKRISEGGINYQGLRNQQFLLSVAFNKYNQLKNYEQMNHTIMQNTFLTQNNPSKQASKHRKQSKVLELQYSSDDESESVISQNIPEHQITAIQKEIPDQNQPLTNKQAQKILTYCNIISLITPHTFDSTRQAEQLVCGSKEPLFVDQRDVYSGSVVCLQDCLCLELDYNVAKVIISLVNSDREKQYIKALLFAFPMLKYFQAKQYVTPEFMITKDQDDLQGENLLQNNNRGKAKAISKIKELKVISSYKYQIPYTKQIYFIIKGRVSLVIDLVHQHKVSTIQHVNSHKHYYPKQILTLTDYELFGFERIGQHTNLRYVVQKGSYLLKINPEVFDHHFESIQPFQESLQKIFKLRNKFLASKMNIMQDQLELQQINRHQVITYGTINHKKQEKGHNDGYLQKNRSQRKLPEIKQVKYYGHQDFDRIKNRLFQHFSPQNTNKSKEFLSMELINNAGLGLQFSKNLNTKPHETVEVRNGWVEVRDKNKKLLRRRRIKQYDVQNPEQQSQGMKKKKKDEILHKLGILNSKQIADHNYKIVKERKSKYEFQDLRKEAREFKRIRDKSRSLPKLTEFFAKKQNRLFNIKKSLNYH